MRTIQVKCEVNSAKVITMWQKRTHGYVVHLMYRSTPQSLKKKRHESSKVLKHDCVRYEIMYMIVNGSVLMPNMDLMYFTAVYYIWSIIWFISLFFENIFALRIFNMQRSWETNYLSCHWFWPTVLKSFFAIFFLLSSTTWKILLTTIFLYL